MSGRKGAKSGGSFKATPKANKPSAQVGNPALPAAHVGQSRNPSKVVAHFANDGNPYLQSLLHPATVFGAKIPDGSYPGSATITEVTRYYFNGGVGVDGLRCLVLGVTQTDGVDALIKRCSLTVGMDDVTGTGNVPYNLGYISGNAVLKTDIWAGTGVGAEDIAHAGYTTITSVARALRLVSCGIRVTCAASGMTNRGWVGVAFLPKGYSRAGWFRTVATNFTELQKLPGLVVEPIATLGDGLHAIYTPTDNGCLEYVPINQDISAAQNPDVLSWSRHDTGGFVVFTVGTDTTAPPPFQLEVVCNYEVLPVSSAVLFTSTPTMDDPLELSHAMNVANSVDNVKKGSGGFDHDHEGTPLEGAEVISLPAQVLTVSTGKSKEVRCVGACTGKVATFTTLTLTRKARGQNRILAARADSGGGSDTFTKLLSMIVPIAEKVLPSVLALL